MSSVNKPQTMPVGDSTARAIRVAARAIQSADALLITAGAGMSADSGLPVFRGNEGFWRAYPPLASQRISFERMAQPMWFAERPRMAWAFYGHRLQLYREARPHAGYDLLRTWGERTKAGCFVVTSNVDGQFFKAGFAAGAVVEQHGSIHRLQCQEPCGDHAWDAPADDLAIDLATLEARGTLPVCPGCGRIARPNILMFNDWLWVDGITRQQSRAFAQWQSAVRGQRVVVLEIGAGKAIPTIRRIGERAAERARTTLVRINPEERDGGEGALVVPLPALQALTLIDDAINGKRGGSDQGDHSRSDAGSETGGPPFRLVPGGEMETVELPAAVQAQRKPSTPSPAASSEQRPIHYVDLRSGFTQLMEPVDLRPAELGYCLERWYEAQRQFVPLPVLRGLTFSGYTMRGQAVVSGSPTADGVRGAALLQIKDPRGELVASVGFGRYAREGAYLWRLLLEGAKVPVQPMEYPREPWIARRVEPAAGRNAAMLAALAFVEYAIGLAWLRQTGGNQPR
jgi:NAD-dependent SIR2 family protein deacetylase